MAVLYAPALVFLNEPFEGIDSHSGRNIKNMCGMLIKRGTTIFITSYIIEGMEKLADSFAIISEGSIQSSFNANEFHRNGFNWEDPYYKFVGDTSSGEMNWLEN